MISQIKFRILKMDAENKLIKWFNDGIYVHLMVIIGFLLVIILLFIFRKKLLNDFQNTKGSIVGFYLIISALILTICYFGYWLTLCELDKEEVENRQFEIATGTVTRYFGVREGNSPTDPIYNGGVIETESGEIIRLYIRDIEVDETYTFIYLKQTRLAVVQNVLEE